jgi:hypothetical protein
VSERIALSLEMIAIVSERIALAPVPRITLARAVLPNEERHRRVEFEPRKLLHRRGRERVRRPIRHLVANKLQVAQAVSLSAARA